LADWAGPAWIGPRRGFRPQGGKEKGRGRKGERDGPAGLKTRRGKRNGFAFLKLVQTIQFKLKFRELKFEPNHKQ
jgi:hypothetical protein